MANRVASLLLLLSPMLNIGCQRIPPIVDYKHSGLDPVTGGIPSPVPIIVVGQIVSSSEIGHPHSSHWDPSHTVQLYQLTARVENVLRGDVALRNTSIFYFMDLGISTGPPRLGMIGKGGTWRTGDRKLFFLQRDSGVLRTVLDNYALCVQPVLTGAHPNYQPRPGESVHQRIVDILLTRGERCSDQEMAQAVSQSTAYSYDLAYAVQKLQQLANNEVPIVKNAARDRLEELSRSWPKIRTGWPDANHTNPTK